MNNGYHYMHIWLVEKLYGYSFCEKPIFPYYNGINLFNYHGGCKTLRMVDSILNPN